MQSKIEEEKGGELAKEPSLILEITEGVKILIGNMLGKGIIKSRIRTITLPESLKSIDDGALHGFASLRSIHIPNAVTNIGESAFSDCEKLQSIVLPQNLQEIKGGTFSRCHSLQSINIPNGVTKIGDCAFLECGQLQYVTLPPTLQEIGDLSFSHCSLQSIHIPNTVTKIDEAAFSHCEKILSIKLPPSLQVIYDGSFSHCKSLQSIIIPHGVTKIGISAFNGCEKLQHVTLPQSLQEIEYNCFVRCKSLQSIIIPNGVTQIGSNTFQECEQLQSVTLPRSLQQIDRLTFYKCKSLQFIIIPDSVTRIESFAFQKCSALQVIALPKHVIVRPAAFVRCEILNRVNIPDITNWLKNRFDDLPLHQLCYNINHTITADKLASIQIDDPTLTAVDAMGMTPLHILCCNPSATSSLIQQLVSKNHDAAQIRNIAGMTPLHSYLISKYVISHDDHQKVSSNDLKGLNPVAVALIQDGTRYGIHEMIYMGLRYEVIDVVLALTGRCVGTEVNKKNEATGLYPFMSGAISHQYRLVDVYMMRKESVNDLR